MSAGLRHSRHGAGDLRGRGCAEVRLGARRSRPVGRRIGGSLWRSADVTSGIRSIPGSDRRALKSGIGTVAAGTLARHRPQRPATDGVPGTAPHGRRLAVREIARRLARALSTVSRELRRNLRPHDRGIYDGDLVQARVRGGPRRPRRRCRVASLSCGGSCRASSRRSGAVRRSPRICGKLIRSGRLGPVSRGHPSSAAPRGRGRPEQDIDQEAAHRLAGCSASTGVSPWRARRGFSLRLG